MKTYIRVRLVLPHGLDPLLKEMVVGVALEFGRWLEPVKVAAERLDLDRRCEQVDLGICASIGPTVAKSAMTFRPASYSPDSVDCGMKGVAGSAVPAGYGNLALVS